jgi:dTDP-glucose 4,6-dehydratase
MLNKNYLIMKNILITGGTGFIGSHLAEYFARKNFKVTVYDKYNSNNSIGWIKGSFYEKKINVVLGDVCDFGHLEKVVKKNKFVIHLAALIGIPYSYVAPKSYLDTNVIGTYNILEACKNHKVERVITTSTSEVYGSGLTFPMNENHPTNTQSPYSASKLAGDNLAYSYAKSFELPLIIVRPFNVYGQRQSDRAIIPTIIGQLISKQKKLKLGNLNSRRDYTYVNDLCDAYYKILTMKKISKGEIFNTGSGKNFSILEIKKKIEKIIGIEKDIIIQKSRLRPKKSEVNSLLASTKKIKRYSNWEAKTNFENGLKETIKWVIKNNNHLDPYNFKI